MRWPPPRILPPRIERVQKVCIWTPDKDLAQCVDGDRVVQVDRKAKTIRDAAGVRAKFGVEPALIPDFLALVGDAADGYPGIAGIGAVGAARLLNRHGPIEAFPPEVLGERREQALLFKRLATLRRDAPRVRRCRPAALARTHPRIRCLDAAHGCAAAARTWSGGKDSSRECIARRVECRHGSRCEVPRPWARPSWRFNRSGARMGDWAVGGS